jgi:hypothetical protein
MRCNRSAVRALWYGGAQPPYELGNPALEPCDHARLDVARRVVDHEPRARRELQRAERLVARVGGGGGRDDEQRARAASEAVLEERGQLRVAIGHVRLLCRARSRKEGAGVDAA